MLEKLGSFRIQNTVDVNRFTEWLNQSMFLQNQINAVTSSFCSLTAIGEGHTENLYIILIITYTSPHIYY